MILCNVSTYHKMPVFIGFYVYMYIVIHMGHMR